MRRFKIQDREAGNIIESGLTQEQAEKMLAKFEETDKKDGTYKPDFYEIVEEKHQYKVLNTKNNQEYTYSDIEARKLFVDNNNLLDEKAIEKAEYDYILEHPEEFFDEENIEEEKANFIKLWTEGYREVLSGSDYVKALIEAETWTSPSGVRPLFEVIEVTNE